MVFVLLKVLGLFPIIHVENHSSSHEPCFQSSYTLDNVHEVKGWVDMKKTFFPISLSLSMAWLCIISMYKTNGATLHKIQKSTSTQRLK